MADEHPVVHKSGDLTWLVHGMHGLWYTSLETSPAQHGILTSPNAPAGVHLRWLVYQSLVLAILQPWF